MHDSSLDDTSGISTWLSINVAARRLAYVALCGGVKLIHIYTKKRLPDPREPSGLRGPLGPLGRVQGRPRAAKDHLQRAKSAQEPHLGQRGANLVQLGPNFGQLRANLGQLTANLFPWEAKSDP